jgi:hypothetical protein
LAFDDSTAPAMNAMPLTPSMIAENSGPPTPAFAGFAGKGRRRGVVPQFEI